MSHVRKQIRDKVKALLTGLATTGANVFSGRVYSLTDDQLPALCIFTDEEEIDDEVGKVSRTQHRGLNVKVVGNVKVTTDLYDVMDTIAVEVETAMFTDRFLTRSISAMDLTTTTMEINSELEKPVGEIELTFRVQYLTAEGAPSTVA